LVGVLSLGLCASTAWAQSKVIRYAGSADVKVFDPIVNTSGVTLQHGYMVYDNLFSYDSGFKVQPQMIGSHSVSADGLTYTMTLRPGLKWHDGTPVTTADILPSIRRWAERDGIGRKMVQHGMTLAAVDAQTFTLAMKERYGLVLDGLANISGLAAFMMRAKDAATDPSVAVSESIGSGPFKFVKAEHIPGSRIVYERNPDYVARTEKPDFYSGSRAVKIDRVEWMVMPDSNTGVAALNRGEIDIMEQPPVDLLRLIKGNPQITVKVNNRFGVLGFVRPNHLHPPFDNMKARQALMHIIDQEEFLRAAFGEPEYYKVCWSFMACDNAMSSEAGAEKYRKPDIARAKQLMAEAGYKGEKIVVLHATDLKWLHDFSTVLEQRMREAGWNLDVQQMDWANLTTRRTKQEPPAQGGWNLFITGDTGIGLMSVSGSLALSSDCDRKGWLGWACDEVTQALRDQWSKEPDLAKRKEIAVKTQLRAAEFAHVIPLGQFLSPVAFRNTLTNVLELPWPAFWAMEKR
jgi:peptide/nickel transport system substrate-binding protein